MLFEGEGCVCAGQKGRKRKDGTFLMYPVLSIGMTDEDPVRRFGEFITGGTFYAVPRNGNRKRIYGWRVYGRTEIERVFAVLRPWLSLRRVQQFEDTLDAYRLSRHRAGYSDTR